MATAFRVTTRIVRGTEKFCIDLRSIGGGRDFFNSKADAEERLIEIQNSGIDAANLRVADKHELVETKKILLPLGASVRQAVEFFARFHKTRGQKKLDDAIAGCLASKIERKCRERYVNTLRYDLNSLSRFCGDVFVDLIDQSKIEAWLRSGKWKPKTINNKAISAHTLFAHCLDQGWVVQNPCSKIKPAIIDNETPGILTVEQCQDLLRATQRIDPGFLAYVALALFAGIRPAEISRLTWTKIDTTEGIVRIDGKTSKTRKTRRIVHLSKNAIAWLKLGGDVPALRCYDRLSAIRAECGFEYTVKNGPRGKGIPWPHDAFRHSFVSYSIPIHGISETAREAGHSETVLHQNYKELVSKKAARKFWAIMP